LFGFTDSDISQFVHSQSGDVSDWCRLDVDAWELFGCEHWWMQSHGKYCGRIIRSDVDELFGAEDNVLSVRGKFGE
jgi:hypothetical protein